MICLNACRSFFWYKPKTPSNPSTPCPSPILPYKCDTYTHHAETYYMYFDTKTYCIADWPIKLQHYFLRYKMNYPTFGLVMPVYKFFSSLLKMYKGRADIHTCSHGNEQSVFSWHYVTYHLCAHRGKTNVN